MADITNRYQGAVASSGKRNWRGDQTTVPQGGQSIYESSSVQLAELGERAVLGDRVFRYAKAGDAIAAGGVASREGENIIDVTAGGAVASGARAFTWYAATAMSKDTYAEGYLYAQSGTAANLGYTYRIKTHNAITATTNGTLYLYDELKVTVNTADKWSVIQNPYVSLKTGGTSVAMGIAPIAVTTGDYFWLQTWGPCAAKCAGGTAGGDLQVSADQLVAKILATTSGAAVGKIATSMQVQTASEKGMVFLTIAP